VCVGGGEAGGGSVVMDVCICTGLASKNITM
jgi:hypothetical protein